MREYLRKNRHPWQRVQNPFAFRAWSRRNPLLRVVKELKFAVKSRRTKIGKELES